GREDTCSTAPHGTSTRCVTRAARSPGAGAYLRLDVTPALPLGRVATTGPRTRGSTAGTSTVPLAAADGPSGVSRNESREWVTGKIANCIGLGPSRTEVQHWADRERQHDDQRPGVAVETVQVPVAGLGEIGQEAPVEPDDDAHDRNDGDQGDRHDGAHRRLHP